MAKKITTGAVLKLLLIPCVLLELASSDSSSLTIDGFSLVLCFLDVVLVINQTDNFLGFLDPVVVIQVLRSFEGEDLQEDEGLEGDEDEDVFGNPEPLSGLGVREFGEDEVEETVEGLAHGSADLVEGA